MDGINYPTMGTGSTGLDEQKILKYDILPVLKMESARKCSTLGKLKFSQNPKKSLLLP